MRIITLALTFAGTLIGAGFISGKEVVTFFGDAGIFSIALSCLAIGGFSYVFIRLGSLYDGDIEFAILGKHKNWAVYTARTANFITLCVMIAGGEYVLNSVFKIHGGGIITAICALPFAYGKGNTVGILNSIIVPIAVGSLIYVAIKTSNPLPISGSFSIAKPLLYSALNLLASGSIVAKSSKGISRSGAVIASIIVSTIIFVLILAIKTAVVGYENSDMPVTDVFALLGIEKLGGIIIYTAVFSTAVSALRLVSDGRKFAPVTAVSAGLVVSVVGFGNLTDFTYPLIGAVGIVYGILSSVKLVSVKIKPKLIRSPLQGKANV